MTNTTHTADIAALIEAFNIADQRTINLGDLRALTGMNHDNFADAVSEAYEEAVIQLIALHEPTDGDAREAVMIAGTDRHLARLR